MVTKLVLTLCLYVVVVAATTSKVLYEWDYLDFTWTDETQHQEWLEVEG